MFLKEYLAKLIFRTFKILSYSWTKVLYIFFQLSNCNGNSTISNLADFEKTAFLAVS
jgi:hypothetical protein